MPEPDSLITYLDATVTYQTEQDKSNSSKPTDLLRLLHDGFVSIKVTTHLMAT
jgi:hypothetical protein